MAYVQTVFVQIPAPSLAEASRPGGLLRDLDDHRAFLRQLPGFQGMRVSRSINEQGNVLVTVETRWEDDSSLLQYETGEPTVVGIIDRYQDLIVPGSLQVLDLEALREETVPSPTEIHARLALPLMIPLGVLAFALLVIYGLSRVYLDISNEAATALAAAIALGILGTAWYVATNPGISRTGIASLVTGAAALLISGVIFAAVHEEGEAGGATGGPPGVESPTPAPAPGEVDLLIKMVPVIKFDVDQLTLPANTKVTVRADNQDGGVIHNWAMYTGSDARNLIARTDLCTAPCVKDVTFTTPGPGRYFFRCDLHPTQMTGTVTVR